MKAMNSSSQTKMCTVCNIGKNRFSLSVYNELVCSMNCFRTRVNQWVDPSQTVVANTSFPLSDDGIGEKAAFELGEAASGGEVLDFTIDIISKRGFKSEKAFKCFSGVALHETGQSGSVVSICSLTNSVSWIMFIPWMAPQLLFEVCQYLLRWWLRYWGGRRTFVGCTSAVDRECLRPPQSAPVVQTGFGVTKCRALTSNPPPADTARYFCR